jgi:hypothetical protein
MRKAASITMGKISRPVLSRDGRTMVVRIPISFRRQGGRKQVVTPPTAAPWTSPPRVDSAMVKAIVRAHRWQDMLESGRYSTMRELASKAEKINEAYLGRVLRLTLLSPRITEAILSGRQPHQIELATLLKPFPIEWNTQSAHFEFVTA